MKYILLIATLALFGCESNTSINAKTVAKDGMYATVDIVTLEDGTKCAVMIGSGRGALDCNWKN